MRLRAIFLCALNLYGVSAFAESAGECVRLQLVNVLEMKAGSRWTKASGPALTAVSSLPGAHGGKRIVLERSGKEWGSVYRFVPNAPAGNPFWFSLIGGPRVAAFFGFNSVSKLRITVPDADEVAGALKKLNEALRNAGRETTGVTFYPASPDQVIPDEIFLKRFVEHRELPLATEGPLAIHDLNYHLASIYLPNFVVDHAIRVSRRVLDFVEFAKKGGTVRPEVLDRLLGAQATNIDLMGDFSVEKGRKLSGISDRDTMLRQFEFRPLASFVDSGLSPNRALEGLIANLDGKEGLIRGSEQDHLFELFERFIATHPESEANERMKGYSPGQGESVMREIDRKRGSVAQAVVDLER